MNWRTHDVFNQFSELSDYNLFTTDRALTEALGRCADWSSEQLTTFGASLGSAGTYALADNANRHKPELQTFDARGRRIDFVDFHPSWHSVLGMYREQGHALAIEVRLASVSHRLRRISRVFYPEPCSSARG